MSFPGGPDIVEGLSPGIRSLYTCRRESTHRKPFPERHLILKSDIQSGCKHLIELMRHTFFLKLDQILHTVRQMGELVADGIFTFTVKRNILKSGKLPGIRGLNSITRQI